MFRSAPLNGLSQINSMGYAKIKDSSFRIQCGKSQGGKNQTIWQYTLSGVVIIENQNIFKNQGQGT